MTQESFTLRQGNMSGDKKSPDMAGREANDACPPLSVAAQEGSERLFSLFCAHKRGTMGNAPNTVKNARSKLDGAIRFIGLPPWAWRPEHIDAHLTFQADVEGNHAATQAIRISTLRQFQNWLLQDRGLCNEIAKEFGTRPDRFITEENSIPYKRRRHERKTPIFPLNPKQVQRLIEEFDFEIETAKRLGKKSLKTLRRDKTITLLLLLTGIRADELANLRVTYFLSDARHPQFGDYAILRVIGKGSKERSVRLYNPAIKQVMDWYMDHVRPAFLTKRTDDPSMLFLSERGCRLCKRQYRRSLAKVGENAGLPMAVRPHLLRHTYATQMATTIGSEALQRQLGHEYLSTTLGTYYHQDPEAVGQEVTLDIEKLTNLFDEITGDHEP